MARTGTSQLLRSQTSRQQAIWQQEDQWIDYEWSLSDKSAEALAFYTNHYADRANSPMVNPDKLLSYQKKLTSANRAYTSNEIQRASISVIEGNLPDQYKLDTLMRLYDRAIENEDYDLAQGLRLQADNQAVRIQNQAASGGGYGGSGTSAAEKEYIAGVKKLAQGVQSGRVEFRPGLTVQQIANVVATNGNNAAMDLILAYSDPSEHAGLADSTPLQAIYSTIASGYQELMEYANKVSDPVSRAELVNDINYRLSQDSVDIGGKKINLQTLEKIANDEAEGNPSMRLIKTPEGFSWANNQIIDQQIRFDEAGQPYSYTRYGDANAATIATGYTDPNKKLAYKLDKASGQYIVATEEEAYNKQGKLKKGMLTRDDMISQAGFVKGENGLWTAGDQRLANRLLEFGIGDIAQGIKDDTFVLDPSGNIEFRYNDRLFEVFKNDLEGFNRIREVKGLSNTDYLKMSGATAAPSTTRMLGGVEMVRDLQSNLQGSALQQANTGRMFTSGGTSGILQQAANAKTINQLASQPLQVRPTPQAPSLSVTPIPAPTPIRVNDTRYATPLPLNRTPAPSLTVRPTAPTAPTPVKKISGGLGVSSGSGFIQGGANVLNSYSGTLRVQ
jgi:hypothetical protein